MFDKKKPRDFPGLLCFILWATLSKRKIFNKIPLEKY
jgi:hypothetical protein